MDWFLIVGASCGITWFIIFALKYFLTPWTIKCRDCRFMEEDWLTSLQGRGTYRFSYCARLPHDCKVVDPEVERECEHLKKKEK